MHYYRINVEDMGAPVISVIVPGMFPDTLEALGRIVGGFQNGPQHWGAVAWNLARAFPAARIVPAAHVFACDGIATVDLRWQRVALSWPNAVRLEYSRDEFITFAAECQRE